MAKIALKIVFKLKRFSHKVGVDVHHTGGNSYLSQVNPHQECAPFWGAFESRRGVDLRKVHFASELVSGVPPATGRSVSTCMGGTFISQRVFIKSFCKSQFPHQFVTLFFTFVMIQDKLTDSCGS